MVSVGLVSCAILGEANRGGHRRVHSAAPSCIDDAGEGVVEFGAQGRPQEDVDPHRSASADTPAPATYSPEAAAQATTNSPPPSTPTSPAAPRRPRPPATAQASAPPGRRRRRAPRPPTPTRTGPAAAAPDLRAARLMCAGCSRLLRPRRRLAQPINYHQTSYSASACAHSAGRASASARSATRPAASKCARKSVATVASAASSSAVISPAGGGGSGRS